MAKGDPATFAVVATPQDYSGPIYLRLGNVAGSETWDVNPLPPGGGTAHVTIDTSGWVVGPPFEISVEAWDALPD